MPASVILRDLIRYLEHQRQLGVSFLLGDAAPDPAPARVPTAPDRAAPPAEACGRGAGRPASGPSAAGADARRADREARERRFEAECARFVQEALELIARARTERAGTPESGPGPGPGQEPRQPRLVQQTMFAPPPMPIAWTAPGEPAAAPPRPPGDEKAALEAIAAEIASCTLCPLHAGRTRPVPGTGNHRAGLVLIGEAPGQEEDRQGLPFVGRSGQLLTDILRAVGLAREDVFICNILKCRPPDNRDPEQEEAAACAVFLSRQLQIIQPKLILCLGRVAAQRLLKTGAALRVLRRELHFHEGVPVLATFHPAALLRQPAQKRDAWDDIRRVRALYDALIAGDTAR